MIDQILAAYAVLVSYYILMFRDVKISYSVNWKQDMDQHRSQRLPLQLLAKVERRRWLPHVLLWVREYDFVESAGKYFSQENPVIREITQRVQTM